MVRLAPIFFTLLCVVNGMRPNPWEVSIVLGGMVLTAFPLLPTYPYRATGATVMVGLLLTAVVKSVKYLSQYVSRIQELLSVRGYAIAILLSYAYVLWNVGVLFDIQPGQSGAILVFVALIYAVILSALALLVKGGIAGIKRLHTTPS